MARNADLQAMEPNPHDSILARMRADHRALLEAVDALERAIGDRRASFPARTVRPLAERLAAEYAAHVIEEDGLMVPLLDGPVSTRQLALEHAELGAMIAAFRETLGRPAHRMRDEQLRVQAEDLIALMRSQIRKEETLVFAVAARQTARAANPTSPKRRPPAGGPS
jgi:hemerythrin-like domain-containing protein